MGKPTNPTVKKSGGSALKRLKTSLQSANLIGPQSAHSTKISKKKNSAKRLSELHSARKSAREQLRSMEAKSRESNPFEMKFSKPKYEVLNRKVKGVVGKPGLQRKKGEELRKKTLEVELGRKNKESAFVDRRFGEGDADMSIEDKMLERFMKEKSKRSDRSSTYNLEEESLTHMGHSLADDDAFLDAGLQRVDEDSDDGQIDRDTVKYTHFGGFDDEDEDPNRKKSKNEIMKEVIAKSKMHKRERQKQKEDDQDLAAEVDAELDDIRGLLNIADKSSSSDKPRRAPLPSQAQALAAAGIQAAAPSVGKRSREEDEDNDNDYDQFVRELAYDRRAKPTDRLKTEEEIALEEKERLEKLERDRVRRMQGLPTEDEEKAAAVSDRAKRAKGGKRETQADDLGDEQYGIALDKVLEREEEVPLMYKDGILVNKNVFLSKGRNSGGDGSGDEDEDDEEEESGSEEGSEIESSDEEGEEGEEGSDEEEREDDEGDGEDDSGEEGEEDGTDLETAPPPSRGRKQTVSADALSDEYEEDDGDEGEESDEEGDDTSGTASARTPDPTAAAELPYTFKAPTSHADFLTLTANRSPADVSTIIQRLRVLHNPKLGGNNKAVLETLFGILSEHLEYVASGSNQPESTALDIQILDLLSTHIIQLSQTFPTQISDWALTKVSKLQSRVAKSSKPIWPTVAELVSFKLIGSIFSTSDLVHPVVTPAMIVLGSVLEQGVGRTVVDLGKGLWICEVVFEYQQQSKRYVPELINYLSSMVVALLPSSTEPTSNPPGFFPLNTTPPSAFRIQNLSTPSTKIPFAKLFAPRGKGSKSEDVNTDEVKVALLVGGVQLLGRAARCWNESVGVAFEEVFGPVVEVLKGVDVEALEGVGKETVTTVLTLIEGLIASARLKRRPLQLQKRKPVPIATYVPRFQEHYSIDRKRNDPNTERNNKAKLQFQYKKEFKGAVRELRKDAAFVARKRREEQKEKDVAYKKKMDKLMGQLGSQEGAMRGYEREAKKAKKRR
ncbi:nucleolar complex protein 14 [Rhizophlyctis rosea]|uniref:Nucleolar complex protein 14 n=1 Tax=Rhizophlyctis rosea TaxID=64517 RepID=A0AAD5S541_9FUNG|nr:nucleolar complex protein 14 [Rhizophlyctis rosea]